MRLGLIVLLCLLNAGCAIVRDDKNEPVDNGPRQEKAEPVLKPSEVLKPKSLELASPITDHFYMRGTYFRASVTTDAAARSGRAPPDTTLSGEDDLGLDDKVDQGRMEFDIRMRDKQPRAHRLLQAEPLQRTAAAARHRLRRLRSSRPDTHLPQPSSTGACSHSPTPIHSSRPIASRRARAWEFTSSKRTPRVASRARSIARRSDNVGIFPTIALNARLPHLQALGGHRCVASSSRPAPKTSTARWPTTTPTSSTACARTWPSGWATASCQTQPAGVRSRPAGVVRSRHRGTGAVHPRQFLSAARSSRLRNSITR